MNDYKLADYKQASYQLNNLLKQNTNNDTLNYFFGVVNYELKDYQATISSLDAVPPVSIYYDKSQYRLILTYLKIKDKEVAVKIIDQCLLNRGNLFYEKLVELKAELSKY